MWSSTVRDLSKVKWCLHSGPVGLFWLSLLHWTCVFLSLLDLECQIDAKLPFSRCCIMTNKLSRCFTDDAAEMLCIQNEGKPHYYSETLRSNTYVMRAESLACRWILIKYKSLLKTLIAFVVCYFACSCREVTVQDAWIFRGRQGPVGIRAFYLNASHSCPGWNAKPGWSISCKCLPLLQKNKTFIRV